MATVVCELQIRNDTAANWTSNDPTMLEGEMGYETDTTKLKWGDGSTAWTSLAYWAPTIGTGFLGPISTTDSTQSTSVSTGSLILAGGAGIAKNAFIGGYIDVVTEMLLTERADHSFTPVATRGILWVRSDSPNSLMFTDDAGTDFQLNLTSGIGIVGTTRVTGTYTILVTDEVVFANTDSTAYTATLPAGTEGRTFKIINSGSSGNTLTLAPDGSEHLLGANSTFLLLDGETLDITYNTTDGWY